MLDNSSELLNRSSDDFSLHNNHCPCRFKYGDYTENSVVFTKKIWGVQFFKSLEVVKMVFRGRALPSPVPPPTRGGLCPFLDSSRRHFEGFALSMPIICRNRHKVKPNIKRKSINVNFD